MTDPAPVRFDPTTPEARRRYAAAKRLDGRSGAYAPYEYGSTRLRVAVNAALATRRPLLLRGEPGAGKSSVAYDVALVLGWSYYEHVVSSRMTASDLLWQTDAIERLNDASRQVTDVRPIADYVRAQTLWWVLDPASARMRETDLDPARVALDPAGAVLLLDEIDKADPDLPNDLLVPLGDGRFRVPELGDRGDIHRTRPSLIVITSNGERELPAPFLRRCVCVELATPNENALLIIAQAHRPELRGDGEAKDRAVKLIERMFEIRKATRPGQHKPGTAEVLDALHACFDLGIRPGDDDWKSLTLAMGWKNTDEPPAAIADKPPRPAT